MNKDLLAIADLAPQDVEKILNKASAFKRKHDEGIRRENILDGKVVALIFEKPSLRTKVAFEVATTYLGGVPIFLSSSQILASGNMEAGRESIPDIARNLERFADLVVARVYKNEVIREISDSITKPVINALCDCHHPTQALADIMAIKTWVKPESNRIKVAFVGDGNNVATSLMQACAMMGFDFAIASPKGYEVPMAERDLAFGYAKANGSRVEFMEDPYLAVKESDVVYTDTFVSMGQEKEKEKRLKAFSRYQVNTDLMARARKSAVFMHCLPAHRGEEVVDEVIDSSNSIVFDQAECRLHVAKSLLATYLG